jgi:ABC-type multidrug transport system ATPase subunit
VIETRLMTARSAPVALAPLTFKLGAGVHALLGRPEDGVPLVLAVLAGRVRPRAGTVRVLGEAPGDGTDAGHVRARIAYVPRDPMLPEALRVHEMLDLASAIRQEPVVDAAERLAVLGVAPLAARRVGSLSLAEARAVAMAEALTSSKARVLLLEEPYVVDPRAVGMLADLLHARARDGACVVFGTASVRDAADLGDDQLIFDRGVLVQAFSAEGAALPERDAASRSRVARPVRMALKVSDTPRVLAVLAAEPAVLSVESTSGSIVITGTDATELAAAVGRAVLAADVDLVWLRAEAPRIDELQA